MTSIALHSEATRVRLRVVVAAIRPPSRMVGPRHDGQPIVANHVQDADDSTNEER